MSQFLETRSGRRIAYHKSEGKGPGVVFLGGFMSDMEGSKATFLEDWAQRTGRAYLRFDYSGHGQSSGAFDEGAIGDWAEDAQAAIAALTDGPQVLVGSSMGGWISLLTCKAMPDKVAGLVTIAAAPDFTEDSMWPSFSDEQKRQVMEEGRTLMPSDYGEPYVITKRLIEEGRDVLVMRDPIPLPFPVRMVQGTEDNAVTRDTALRLLDHVGSDDVRLTFKKGADHSFSDPDSLQVILSEIEDVLARVDNT